MASKSAPRVDIVAYERSDGRVTIPISHDPIQLSRLDSVWNASRQDFGVEAMQSARNWAKSPGPSSLRAKIWSRSWLWSTAVEGNASQDASNFL